MSQNFGVIIQRLRQTLYNLEKFEFINRATVKHDDTVTTTFGSFDVAMLQWKSKCKNGKEPINQPYILLIKKSEGFCCDSDGTSAYASVYHTTIEVVERFLSEGRKTFVLTVADFDTTVPVGLDVYSVFGKNSLRVLQLINTASGDFKQLSEYIIGCETARAHINDGTFPTTAGQVELTKSEVSDLGVCPCKYNC